MTRTKLQGVRSAVIGAARSGIHAAAALQQLGANVVLSDGQPIEKIPVERLAEIERAGIELRAGADVASALPTGTDLVVTSPGVPKHAPVLVEAVRRGIPVWSEIELAYRIAEAPIVAVTGTNGKTTTTLLASAMLNAAGKNAVVCGNVSADDVKRTLVQAAMEARGPNSVLVAEISSFQLEWVETFAPQAAILTNITPDHMDRHKDFEEYIETKARIFAAQTMDQLAIWNALDPVSRTIAPRLNHVRTAVVNGPSAWVTQGRLMLSLNEIPSVLMDVLDLPPTLPGRHSIDNVLAAALAASELGATPEAIAEAVRGFRGVAHRMELVAEVGGVRYINNSMCTNVAAAVASLAAMNRPTIVIAGGADKELDYSGLTLQLELSAKRLILIGAAADKMERTFRSGGFDRITRATSLEDAVEHAQRLAHRGDAVLLSPACASFDMFRDFEHRGAAFRAAVNALRDRLVTSN